MGANAVNMPDEPNAFVLQVGETKELTWTFTVAGEVLIGCHQPGHYQAGMVGKIKVAAATAAVAGGKGDGHGAHKH